jgi:hypothetical protein
MNKLSPELRPIEVPLPESLNGFCSFGDMFIMFSPSMIIRDANIDLFSHYPNMNE